MAIKNNKTNLEAYTSSRLIPLDKSPGVRPIGIGEVIRRIVGKIVLNVIKPDILLSVGSVQLCAGQEAGCEAAIHAMNEIFLEADTDAILLVDASNAFNVINRKVLLHNIQYLCPSMSTYVYNSYCVPSRLFVQGGMELQSEEGATQGDPLAMPEYGIGITPLLDAIKDEITSEIKQVAFADDIGGAGSLCQLQLWWNNIERIGPLIGYYPNGAKSWLIVKPAFENEAKNIFSGTEIQITTDGLKYLDGYIGSDSGKTVYEDKKEEEWVNQLELLTTVAMHEPQAAYAVFVAGLKHRYNFFLRVLNDIGPAIERIDHIINTKFLPAILDGQQLSQLDREVIALPVRLGGLGIPIFSQICSTEYDNSIKISKVLTDRVINQNRQDPGPETDQSPKHPTSTRLEMLKDRNERHEKILARLRAQMNDEQKLANELAQQKGASAWLTALPLEAENYALNKREFFDAVALRYRWQMKRLPIHCACGNKFSADHAVSCLKGEYVHRRHDEVRDVIAKLLEEVTPEVSTEPTLRPLSG